MDISCFVVAERILSQVFWFAFGLFCFWVMGSVIFFAVVELLLSYCCFQIQELQCFQCRLHQIDSSTRITKSSSQNVWKEPFIYPTLGSLLNVGFQYSIRCNYGRGGNGCPPGQVITLSSSTQSKVLNKSKSCKAESPLKSSKEGWISPMPNCGDVPVACEVAGRVVCWTLTPNPSFQLHMQSKT